MALPIDKRYIENPAFGTPEQRQEKYAQVQLPDKDDRAAIERLVAATERFDISNELIACLRNPLYREELPFTPEQVFLLQQEKLGGENAFIGEYTEGEEYEHPCPTPGEMRLIGLGEKDCPDCAGNKGVHRIPLKGAVTGVKVWSPQECRCTVWRLFFQQMENPLNVGEAYFKVRLNHLDNFKENFGTYVKAGAFPKLLHTVQTFPANSYLLAGPAGKGKSTLMVALYAYALHVWAQKSFIDGTRTKAVWIANATQLAAEIQAWETKDVGRDENDGPPTPLPRVTVDAIRHAVKSGHKPALFLDEFDKINNSEFQLRKFSELIEAVHSAGGQIVLTSNLSEFDLRVRLKEQFGPGIPACRWIVSRITSTKPARSIQARAAAG